MADLEVQNSNNSLENVVVVGSGPAGYTAALYAARANLNPILITGYQEGGIPGGQLMTTTHVENFPGFPDGIMGPELMDRMRAQAVRWGTRLIEGDATAIDLSKRPYSVQVDGETISSHSLIIATGASANRLGIPDEAKFWSHGISACAICDGATPQFRNEQLAVVGGGDSACEEAVYLTKYGSHVHLIVRRESLRASRAMADRVLANPQITVHWNRQLGSLAGTDWLEQLSLLTSEGEPAETLAVRGIFYAIGHTPNTRLLEGQLPLDSKGYLITQAGSPATAKEGIFAAGDVADSQWRQAITAAASGCQAALAAERWLSEHNLATTVSRQVVDPIAAEQPLKTEEVTEENFNQDALWQGGSYALRKLYHNSKKPLLVIYTSPDCGPCHVFKPQLRRILNELEGAAQGVEINLNEHNDIATQAGVTGTPTLQLFMGKELKQQWRGVQQRSSVKAAIEALL